VIDKKNTILIVEDDLDVADMLNAYFKVQGYEVLTVNWGEDGIRAAETSHPNLIILDIRLPDIDGFQVAERLRANRSTKEIPIIFLTEKKEREDRLHGLEIGGDDYITKPFDIQELRLRMRNALKRQSKGVLKNPVTDLPDGPLVDERLRELITENDWAILAITLANLENFKETYGFIASDDVLRATSLMIHNIMRDVGTPNDFLGHLTPTTFGLVTSPAKAHELRERIETRLDQSLEYFYPLKDRDTAANQETALSIQINELLESDVTIKNISEIKDQLLNF
jgi:DNA-binding response OmpR family regulator